MRPPPYPTLPYLVELHVDEVVLAAREGRQPGVQVVMRVVHPVQQVVHSARVVVCRGGTHHDQSHR
jgi:hypothetical protein